MSSAPLPAAPPALELEGIEVRHGSVTAVHDLSLSIGKGEIVGLIGPNGAGKSSTLHAIMGLLRLRTGEVRLFGRSLRGRSPEQVARSGVALVPEGRRIFGRLTVAENIRLGCAARRSKEGLDADLARIYELFPVVAEFGKRHAGALSGGQQQQVAIARALIAKPDVLLLDEPSLGLSPTMVDIVFGALEHVRGTGVSVLLVEQRAVRTVAFADRTHVISSGLVRLTLTPKDAGDTDKMVAAYFS